VHAWCPQTWGSEPSPSVTTRKSRACPRCCAGAHDCNPRRSRPADRAPPRAPRCVEPRTHLRVCVHRSRRPATPSPRSSAQSPPADTAPAGTSSMMATRLTAASTRRLVPRHSPARPEAVRRTECRPIGIGPFPRLADPRLVRGHGGSLRRTDSVRRLRLVGRRGQDQHPSSSGSWSGSAHPGGGVRCLHRDRQATGQISLGPRLSGCGRKRSTGNGFVRGCARRCGLPHDDLQPPFAGFDIAPRHDARPSEAFDHPRCLTARCAVTCSTGSAEPTGNGEGQMDRRTPGSVVNCHEHP
jgi:hypothetical protein